MGLLESGAEGVSAIASGARAFVSESKVIRQGIDLTKDAAAITAKTVKSGAGTIAGKVEGLGIKAAFKDTIGYRHFSGVSNFIGKGVRELGETRQNIGKAITQPFNRVFNPLAKFERATSKGRMFKRDLKAWESGDVGPASVRRFQPPKAPIKPKYASHPNKIWTGMKPKIAPTMRGAAYIGFGVMGAGYGATKVALNNSIAKSYDNKQGMDPNNLSTDGLTLALARRRHR